MLIGRPSQHCWHLEHRIGQHPPCPQPTRSHLELTSLALTYKGEAIALRVGLLAPPPHLTEMVPNQDSLNVSMDTSLASDLVSRKKWHA